MFTVAALYQFVSLKNYQDMQKPLKEFCNQHHVKGTLILAAEGINGTVAGTREAINQLYSYLQNDERFNNLEYKESVSDKMPFYRMKVKAKKEIVTIGIPEVSPIHINGQYIEAKDWNNLLNDPDVVVIDTRNDYEIKIGTFKNAVNPATESFTEFPEYIKKNFDPKKHKKVAMFCTGGIRCEKASSYMLSQGFKNVYHLKGGILKYLETVTADQSLWEGECFVFDQRVAVKHNLEQGTHDCCYACRLPLSETDRQSPLFEKGVSCPYCYESIPIERKKAFANRQKQVDIASSRQQQHIGLSRAEAKKQKMLLRS